jgi:aspartate/methionine/tyrosine aminotransferase
MRQTLIDLEESQIRQVANAGMGRDDVLKFWFGEGDEVTPDVVRQAAVDSMQRGETFYTHNMGLPELREALAAYTQRLHGHSAQTFNADRIAVTSGGVNALMLAAQALVDAGDDVLAVTPVWPNLVGQPMVMGAKVRTHSLVPRDGQWVLDVDALCADIRPGTKALIVNAPNNPTGWCLSAAEQAALLARCRETGTWIVADEVYERLYYAPSAHGCAPSFLDLAATDDRLVVVHSFSKSFLMTGWRLGWLVMPPDLTAQMGKLIEFNTSCASAFTQRAGVAALANEASITPRVREHLQACRDRLVGLLQSIPGVRVQAPLGGMYAFFQLEGYTDSLALAKRLVTEAGLGLAPGTAFSPHAHGWLRWCFASQDLNRLDAGAQRLRQWLAAQASRL